MQKIRIIHRTSLSTSSITKPRPPRIIPLQNFRRPFSHRPFRVPPNAWDSHMHVIDPHNFPISAKAAYKPHTATLEQAFDNAARLGLPNLVLVQPSIYGTDNSCQLSALQTLGPKRGRAVVVFDPDKTDAGQLERWHELGVRGVRVNLRSVGGKMSGEELRATVRRFAEKVRPLGGWCVQLYVPLEAAGELEPVMKEMRGVKLVLDHFGGLPSFSDSNELTAVRESGAWRTLLRLLDNEDVFVKVSAPYRITSRWESLEPFFGDLAGVRTGRGVVFASDWPHTRFAGVDARRWVEMCLGWCGGDEMLVEGLFRGNAERLWDVER